jgi:hypothetical protein
MEYVPEYAPGEILVCFSKPVCAGFADIFGDLLGIAFKEEWPHGDNVFCYTTRIGSEESVMRQFLGYSEIVEWAERRDVKLENRSDYLSNMIFDLKNLKDDIPELSDEDYKKRLNEITILIKNL